MMPRFAIVVALGVTMYSVSARNPLKLYPLNWTDVTGRLPATCGDGSQAGYYASTYDAVDRTKGNLRVLVWFGDASLCADGASCEALCTTDVEGSVSACLDAPSPLDCFKAKVECSSVEWNVQNELGARTVLSPVATENPFADYFRVFVPQCSHDWFLGRGEAESSRYRGANIAEVLFAALEQQHALRNASLVILGGTRGGGIAALSHAPRLQRRLGKDTRVAVLVDSAWSVDFEQNAEAIRLNPGADEASATCYPVDAALERDSKRWIVNAALEESCVNKTAKYAPRHRCLYASELATSPALSSTSVFFAQSQYDLVQLAVSNLDTIDSAENAEAGDLTSETLTYDDEAELFLALTSYLEAFGAATRTDLERELKRQRFLPSRTHALFSTSCAQHGYFSPTQFHSFDPQPLNFESFLSIIVGSTSNVDSRSDGAKAGAALVVQRNDKVWDSISVVDAIAASGGKDSQSTGTEVGRITLHEAVMRWAVELEAGGTGNVTATSLLPDNCGSFLCNKSCPSTIEPFTLSYMWDVCRRKMLLVYAGGFILIKLAVFLAALASIYGFRRASSEYWARIEIVERYERDQSQQDDVGAATICGKPSKLERSVSLKKTSTLSQVERQWLYESAASEGRRLHIMVANLSYWAPRSHQEDSSTSTHRKRRNRNTKAQNLRPPENDNVISDDGAAGRSRAESSFPAFFPLYPISSVLSMARDSLDEKLRRIPCFGRSEASAGAHDFFYPKSIASKLGLSAIMGSSGSGKSTLLDILAMARSTGEFAGSHYINGVPSHLPEARVLREYMQHNVSYVRQNDFFFGSLTVRQHLEHAAWLQLPEHMPSEAKFRRVWQVLKLVKLEDSVNTVIGGDNTGGGLSGGQRRRLTVAEKLLRMPSLLLLDEPTSGLDSTSALVLVRILHTLAEKGGITIALSIHQPREEIFSLFHFLAIIERGRLMYAGDPKLALSHFNIQRSKNVSVVTNTANILLDNLGQRSEEQVMELAHSFMKSAIGDHLLRGMMKEATHMTPELSAQLEEVLVDNALSEGRWSWNEHASPLTLMWVLLSRTIARSGFDVVHTCTVAFLGGVLVGSIFVGVETFTSRVSCVYLCKCLGVATLQFLQGTFIGDRYYHEKVAFDMQRDTDAQTGADVTWVAVILAEFLRDSVASSLEAFAFGVPLYWMASMGKSGAPVVIDEDDGSEVTDSNAGSRLANFGLFIILLSLIADASVSQLVLVQIDRNNARVAGLINVALFGLGSLFNGFIIRIEDVPVYLNWLPPLMLSYWAFAGTLINEVKGLIFDCSDSDSALSCSTQTGDFVVRSLSYDGLDVYVCIAAILVMILIFRLASIVDFYFRFVRKRGMTSRSSISSTILRNRLSTGTATQFSLASSKGNVSSIPYSVSKSRLARLRSPSKAISRGNTSDVSIQLAALSKSTSCTPQSRHGSNMNVLLTSASSLKIRNSSLSSTGDALVEDIHAVNERSVSMQTFIDGQTNLQNELGNGGTEYAIERHGGFKLFVNAMLSRRLFLTCFFIDLCSTFYLCLYESSTGAARIIAESITWGFVVFYGIAFIIQFIFLIPNNGDDQEMDCTWVVGHDIMAFVLLLIDILLSVQQVRGTFTSGTVVLFLLIRLTRALRCVLFWRKVNKFHNVRAVRFATTRDEITELLATRKWSGASDCNASVQRGQNVGIAAKTAISSAKAPGTLVEPVIPHAQSNDTVSSSVALEPPASMRSRSKSWWKQHGNNTENDQLSVFYNPMTGATQVVPRNQQSIKRRSSTVCELPMPPVKEVLEAENGPTMEDTRTKKEQSDIAKSSSDDAV